MDKVKAVIAAIIQGLECRRLAGGGFSLRPGGGYRPDATAWAILAYRSVQGSGSHLQAARARLAADQQADGRLGLAPEHPEAFWPTPLAILAWNRTPEFRSNRDRARHFLLTTTGEHSPPPANPIIGHDTTIPGWPWVADTHSWVIPTALGIMALTAAGNGEHERVGEGVRLLLNRQLPGGGWNYGNTTVFDQALHPKPDTTGIALGALAGRVERVQVQPSLDYLAARLIQVPTPLSLTWGLLGLAAWGARPQEADAWLVQCWEKQERYGEYDTVALALLTLALSTREGLPAAFQAPPRLIFKRKIP